MLGMNTKWSVQASDGCGDTSNVGFLQDTDVSFLILSGYP